GVRQEHHLLRNPVQQRRLALRRQVEPPDGDRDHLRARRLERGLHRREILVLSGAYDQPRPELAPPQDQLVHGAHPPPTKVTISSTSPAASCSSAWRALFTTAPLRSTAIRSALSPRCCRSAATVRPSGSSTCSPLTVARIGAVIYSAPWIRSSFSDRSR